MVERLVIWCGTMDHPGVQGESSRLLAWTIKNCGENTDVITALINAGCVPPLVLMLGSEHAVMVNEAALALVLVFSSVVDPEVVEKTKLPQVATYVLNNPNLPPEILANVLSMLTAIAGKGLYTLGFTFVFSFFLGIHCKT